MKRIALKTLLLALIVVEIYICSGFLPAAWQTAILQGLSHISPKTFDYSVVTHPALDYEIEDALRKNVGPANCLVHAYFPALGGQRLPYRQAVEILATPLRTG